MRSGGGEEQEEVALIAAYGEEPSVKVTFGYFFPATNKLSLSPHTKTHPDTQTSAGGLRG